MKMLNKIIGGSVAIVAALAFTASTTQAQNLLVNGGFEDTGLNTNPNSAVNPGTPADFSAGTGSFTPNPVTLTSGPGGQPGINQGWATFGGSQNTMSTATSSPLGGSYALLAVNNPGNNWNPQGAYQIVSGITAGQIYTYSAYYLQDKNNGTNQGTYTTPIDLQLTFGHQVGTNAFVAVAASYNWGFGPVAGTVTNLNEWEQGSVTTVAAPAGATEATAYLFFMDNGQKVQDQIFFDNASLQATPEPASMALVGIGMASLYFIRRRKS
jgi:hypothetical protein